MFETSMPFLVAYKSLKIKRKYRTRFLFFRPLTIQDELCRGFLKADFKVE